MTRLVYKLKLQETGRYHTVKEAIELTGFSRTTICSARLQKRKELGNFHIMDWILEKENRVEKKPRIKRKLRSVFISVRAYGELWGVFYEDTLLKVFKTRLGADAYAYDSALEDARKRGLGEKIKIEDKTPRARHIETGKIYPSIK